MSENPQPSYAYADSQVPQSGVPYGYGSAYPAGQPGPWNYPPTSPPQKNKNRLLYVLGGLGALLILGLIGLTALGIVVGGGKDDKPKDLAAANSSVTAAPAATQVAAEPSTAPATAAATTAPTAAAVAPTPSQSTAVDLPPTDAPTAATKLQMPELKGRNASEADDDLRKLGFTNVDYGSADENHSVVLLLANWTVVKQNVKAGAMIQPDTKIVLMCTKQ
jgi:PASTA domain